MSIAVSSGCVKQWSGELGFSLVGIAPAVGVDEGGYLREYLRRGYHGQMSYLERGVGQRLDPRELVPGARSVICVAINYYGGERPDNKVACGKIARYAWAGDYHKVMKKRLGLLADRIRQAAGGEVVLRCCVDTAAVMEKAYAARAGLGWIGKNGLLINGRYGSWLVLGEIVTDLVFDYDEPLVQQCGECCLCLEGCPGGALVRPYVLDARRCISYLTIESRESVEQELPGETAGWLFGCDGCQEVCPFNWHLEVTKDLDMRPESRWQQVELQEAVSMDEEQFNKRFAGCCVKRGGYEGFVRNARKMLCNH
jgi:epoxyqueuosine reductase